MTVKAKVPLVARCLRSGFSSYVARLYQAAFCTALSSCSTSAATCFLDGPTEADQRDENSNHGGYIAPVERPEVHNKWDYNPLIGKTNEVIPRPDRLIGKVGRNGGGYGVLLCASLSPIHRGDECVGVLKG